MGGSLDMKIEISNLRNDEDGSKWLGTFHLQPECLGYSPLQSQSEAANSINTFSTLKLLSSHIGMIGECVMRTPLPQMSVCTVLGAM